MLEAQDLSKAQHWTSPDDEFSNRASSLTPSSVDFLQGIGAWKYVDQSRVQPYDEMQVWDGANESRMQFDWAAEAERYNAPRRSVATMTENANLTRGLLARISELSGDGEGSLFSRTTVAAIENGEDDQDGLNLSSWPVLSLSSADTTKSVPSRIAARLLIGADGINSPVRNFAGIASKGWDYNRHGVVATLKLEPKEDQSFDSFSDSSPEESASATAYQRFLPRLGGPIALLPLPNNHASLVWSTTSNNAAYLKSLSQTDPESVIALINAAFRLSQTDLEYMFTLPSTPSSTFSSSLSSSSAPQHPNSYTHAAELAWRLPHTPQTPHAPPSITGLQPGTLASFPLRFRQSSSYISPRVALLGDAAHTIHPLAGQGLNLGLADAKALVETIAYGVAHGMDLGDVMMLERYNAARWAEGVKVGGVVDLLNKVYGMDGTVAGWVRGLGMRVLGMDEGVGGYLGRGVRGWVMRQAEG